MITFINRNNNQFACVEYAKELQPIVDNWKSAKTIKFLNGKWFIHSISYSFFIELTRNANIQFKEIYQLS